MSVTAARGFRAAGVACGIKPHALDLAVVAADQSVMAAAVFTTSRTAAPPVDLTRQRVSSGRARAVVLNSGSANAGTGSAGFDDAREVSASVAKELSCDPDEILVCSTGPIGGRLPVAKMIDAIPGLVEALATSGSDDAAHAIMTTDTVAKQAVGRRGSITVGGMAKGAGMLRPDMATMLAVLTTDAAVEPEALNRVLRSAVDTTFNCLNVDGCQSTNDTVILLASGEAGIVSVTDLASLVEDVCRSLTAMLAADAEGASRVIEICVSGAASNLDARQIGRAIADSALVRSSFWGGDPNWGRVLAAAGVAGVDIDTALVRIAYADVVVCDRGVGVDFDEESLTAALVSNFSVDVTVGNGPGNAEVITTDLTPDYVRFNGERS